MTTPDLPTPATAAEMYLAAILTELQAIRVRLPEQPAPADHRSATVELTEPARPASRTAGPARTRTTKTKERHG